MWRRAQGCRWSMWRTTNGIKASDSITIEEMGEEGQMRIVERYATTFKMKQAMEVPGLEHCLLLSRKGERRRIIMKPPVPLAPH